MFVSVLEQLVSYIQPELSAARWQFWLAHWQVIWPVFSSCFKVVKVSVNSACSMDGSWWGGWSKAWKSKSVCPNCQLPGGDLIHMDCKHIKWHSSWVKVKVAPLWFILIKSMEKVKVFHFDSKLEESSQVARAALQLKLISSVAFDWIFLLHVLS